MNNQAIADLLIDIGIKVSEKVRQSVSEQSSERLSAVFMDNAVDTVYQIDRDVEEIIVPLIEAVAANHGGIWLLAEGIGDEENGVALPHGYTRQQCAVAIIMDPIDGTRGIMYDKRPAFFLAAAAPNRDGQINLSHTTVSVMAELPTSRHLFADHLVAIKGEGAKAFTRNVITGQIAPKHFSPSKSKTIIGGFAQLARFFPPGRSVLSAIEDELINRIAPDLPEGKTAVFEDQYISSGGQMYELLMGHDRFVADLRGLLYNKMKSEGKRIGHVCHPYDIAAALIATEAGIILTDGYGNSLDAPFDLEFPVNWIGYANANIKAEVEPILFELLKEYQLLQ